MVSKTKGHFDGRKARSRLKWAILRTLAMEIGAPVLVAELYACLRTLTPRGMYESYGALPRRSAVYNYLYRMAEEGCVKLEKLKDGLSLYLTPDGRQQLRLYDAHWKTKGWSAGRSTTHPADRRSGPFSQPPGSYQGTGRGCFLRRILTSLKSQLVQYRETRRLEGAHRTRAFISYDMPQSAVKERKWIIQTLKAAGFSAMHKSMYVGPVFALKHVVEAVESLGLLPYVSWGTTTPLKR